MSYDIPRPSDTTLTDNFLADLRHDRNESVEHAAVALGLGMLTQLAVNTYQQNRAAAKQARVDSLVQQAMTSLEGT